MSDKMREEFEKVLREDCEEFGVGAPDLRISPCVLDDGAAIYINDLTQSCWWAYRKGWKASRESLVVDLSLAQEESSKGCGSNDIGDFVFRAAKEAIESMGLRVKP